MMNNGILINVGKIGRLVINIFRNVYSNIIKGDSISCMDNSINFNNERQIDVSASLRKLCDGWEHSLENEFKAKEMGIDLPMNYSYIPKYKKTIKK